jgi:DNA ligase-1
VLTDGADFFTQTEAWQDVLGGGTSVPLLSTPRRIAGKNLGRANQTTPEEQARKEVEALFLKQKDKGYRLSGEESPALLLPMLAHPYDKYAKYVQFPAYVQPKLDGVRCLFNGKTFWSRQGKAFLPQVVEHLHCDTQGLVLDGELMLPHEEFSFQQTIEAIKKFRPERSPLLVYFVYDVVLPAASFAERLALLTEWVASLDAAKRVRPVSTLPVADSEELLFQHGAFTQAGFEGTMIRNTGGLYLIGHRSQDLLKYKDFQDAEYPIVDVVEGVAKEAGHAIFVCQTPAAQRFNVRPRGTSEERQQMFREREQLIGRELKVSFQNLSDDGIPRFPVGISIRERDIEG